MQSVSIGDTIFFQEIVQNEGKGYNKNTGIFTAPVTGTYLFTVQVCLYSNKRLSVSIVANGTAITAGHFGDKDWNAICHLTDGQAFVQAEEEVKVLVTYANPGSVIYPDQKDTRWTFFFWRTVTLIVKQMSLQAGLMFILSPLLCHLRDFDNTLKVQTSC